MQLRQILTKMGETPQELETKIKTKMVFLFARLLLFLLGKNKEAQLCFTFLFYLVKQKK